MMQIISSRVAAVLVSVPIISVRLFRLRIYHPACLLGFLFFSFKQMKRDSIADDKIQPHHLQAASWVSMLASLLPVMDIESLFKIIKMTTVKVMRFKFHQEGYLNLVVEAGLNH